MRLSPLPRHAALRLSPLPRHAALRLSPLPRGFYSHGPASTSGAWSDCQPCNFVTTTDCKRYKNTFPKMRSSSSLNCKFGPKIVYELVIKNINIVFRSILIFMEFWGENMHYVLFAHLYQRCRVRKEIGPRTSRTATLWMEWPNLGMAAMRDHTELVLKLLPCWKKVRCHFEHVRSQCHQRQI